jgi:hypothetical protein
MAVSLTDPVIAALVQQNLLVQKFHTALFPQLLYRADIKAEPFPGQQGESHVFTGNGLFKPSLKPRAANQDPTPKSMQEEQWTATLNPYNDGTDVHMPSSAVALASLLINKGTTLMLDGAQTVNRLVRNALYKAALSGWTVATASVAAAATAVPVARINGFTTARRPDLATGSPVKFDTVSGDNPLAVKILLDNGTIHSTKITGFTPTISGDRVGPGILTIADAIPGGRSVPVRGWVKASDATGIVRAGGGNSVGDIGASDLLTLAEAQSGVARLRNMNVPEYGDGFYRCHVDPISEGQLLNDEVLQRLLATLPESNEFKKWSMGTALGAIFIRNSESPQVHTVDGGDTASYSEDDPFAGELWSNGATTGTQIHRALFVGAEAVTEYFLPNAMLVSDVGVNGRIEEAPAVNANGFTVQTDRIDFIVRAPQDRLQQNLSLAWKILGDWVCRTDSATGDASRYKRVCVIEHAG